MASCSARPFITVAIMPMWSAVLRSMPSLAAGSPRHKLPPPMTMAILHAELVDFAHALGDIGGLFRVDAGAAVARQRFAAQLQQHTLIGQLATHAHGRSFFQSCRRLVAYHVASPDGKSQKSSVKSSARKMLWARSTLMPRNAATSGHDTSAAPANQTCVNGNTAPVSRPLIRRHSAISSSDRKSRIPAHVSTISSYQWRKGWAKCTRKSPSLRRRPALIE